MSFNIMGIDPGSNNVGVSVFTLSDDLSIDSVKTFHLILESNSDKGIHDNILDRTNKLSRSIKFLYLMYKPKMVAMESSFINLSRMGAVIPLTKSIHTIEETLYKVDPHIKIVTVTPSVIKKLFNSKQKGKDSVLNALLKKKNITTKMKTLKITDHEVDSIAIAYALLQYIKTNKGMSCIRYLKI